MVNPEVEIIANSIWRANCVKFGQFPLSGGGTSSVYIDLRTLRTFIDEKKVIVDAYRKLAEPLGFDIIADIPTSATPFVSSLCDKLQIGQITPRLSEKKHGTKAHIDGYVCPGQKALVIDDLITQGTNIAKGINILRDEGLVIQDALVIIDRQMSGEENLKRLEINLRSACTVTDLVDCYLSQDRITKQQYESVISELSI